MPNTARLESILANVEPQRHREYDQLCIDERHARVLLARDVRPFWRSTTIAPYCRLAGGGARSVRVLTVTV